MPAIDLMVLGVCLKGAMHKWLKLNNNAILEIFGPRIKKQLTWQVFTDFIASLF